MMRTLGGILGGAVLVFVAAGVASADTIVSYSAAIPFTNADFTNLSLLLPGWCPGCTGSTADSLVSGVAPGGYGPAVTTGVSMASINPTAQLVGYDIRLTGTITGNFSVTNTGTGNVSGTEHLDTYTAISLGSSLSSKPGVANDPTNDLFYTSSGQYGYGPDPTFFSSALNLAPGATSPTFSFTNVSVNADIGCDFYPTSGNGGTAPCGNYNPIPGNGLNPPGSSPAPTINIKTDGLTFYLSSATTVAGLLGVTTSDQNQIKERLTITYDYTTGSASAPAVPEPMTMVLMGGALVGLGLIGKHLKKS